MSGAVRYAIPRDRLDARYLPTKTSDSSPFPGKLISSAEIPSGAEFRFTAGTLTVRFLMADFLYLAWDGAQLEPSYAVVKNDWRQADTRLEQAELGWYLRSDALELHVSTDGTLQLRDAAGHLIRHEAPPRRSGRGWQMESPLPPEACIYGLGERAAHLNLRPGSYRFWNVDAEGTYAPGTDPLYICMPVYLCLQETGSYLIFYDNSHDGRITLESNVDLWFEGGPLRYYLAVAPPPVLLERITLLTGRAPLPPRWAPGYQQSKWGYQTEAEMRRVFIDSSATTYS
jgi:alpha-glucosidase